MRCVPLNARCSRKCAAPVAPSASSTEPTSAYDTNETVGLADRSRTTKRIPFASSNISTRDEIDRSSRGISSKSRYELTPVRASTDPVALAAFAMACRSESRIVGDDNAVVRATAFAAFVKKPRREYFALQFLLSFLSFFPCSTALELEFEFEFEQYTTRSCERAQQTRVFDRNLVLDFTRNGATYAFMFLDAPASFSLNILARRRRLSLFRLVAIEIFGCFDE
mmetsp:Transcript_15931/g.34463  ORF Transcript_15931/g.34463 Transcript_15931/m.34463 type:complete len:224 (+) Transcript_15931:812-1483(+)